MSYFCFFVVTVICLTVMVFIAGSKADAVFVQGDTALSYQWREIMCLFGGGGLGISIFNVICLIQGWVVP